MIPEILSVLNDQSVESSRGWKIKILSVSSFLYQEAGKTLRFALEDCPNETGEMEWIIFLPENWAWNKPFHGEPVPSEKRAEILNRIDLAFWKLDMKIKEVV
ncbi:MAG: hypothetical protein KBA28_02245 [Syntrophaceae bacterium]|jgi:hypothetical protein|nr:hypothetical protein [Syntrophaceae bacterium]HOC58354.1 hypothetical protein [Smithellaceae bacterium]HQM44764.1 hypothetical protein [Smithellaceae bacterium]